MNKCTPVGKKHSMGPTQSINDQAYWQNLLNRVRCDQETRIEVFTFLEAEPETTPDSGGAVVNFQIFFLAYANRSKVHQQRCYNTGHEQKNVRVINHQEQRKNHDNREK
uniref:Uncharacterized protein n=1 Tax=Romanomermis culicivorax TaxID=13658 RepID=A0A915IM22_ROMCU